MTHVRVGSSELEVIELGRIETLHTLRMLFGHEPSPHMLAALAQLAVPVRIPAGTQLAREGTPATAMYFVIEGLLEASRGRFRLGAFGPRSTVGSLAVFSRDPRGFDSVALEDTTALMLSAEDMFEMLEDHFELMFTAMRRLAADAIDQRLRLLPHAGFSNRPRVGLACSPRPLHLVERIQCLRVTFGLEHSFIDELAEIARAATEVRYPAGTRLWSVGDEADHVVMMVCGVISGETPAGARFDFGAGDILGQLDTAAGVPRWFDAVATQDAVALVLDREIIFDVLEDQPELGFDFLRMLALVLLSLRERASEHPPQIPS